MSTVRFLNVVSRWVKEKITGRSGELGFADRVVERGKGASSRTIRTFDAIFTFDDPLICDEHEVPDKGGYFLEENGKAEVTQLIGRFKSEKERNLWVEEQFDRM